MLRAGGTAADAAVAAAAAQCVVLPSACGLGGDAMILVGGRQQPTTAINGNGTAPAAVGPEIPPDGGGTAAVPGCVAALLEAHERFGRLPREEVFAPAARLAADGFVVGEELQTARDAHRSRLERNSAEWPLLDSKTTVGSVVRLPRLAALLAAIGRDGSSAFYSGDAAAAIAAAARADGGTMTIDDLEAYQAIVRTPVAAEFAGARIELSPPTSQGILLLVALNALSRQSRKPDTSEGRILMEVQAIQECFAYRHEVAGDDPVGRLLNPGFLPDLDLDLAGIGPRGYNHTAALTVADRHGQVVSALVSVFDSFGSATFVPELDFHLNSRLLGFDNSGPNAPHPRRRPIHTLSPAIVTSPDRVIGIATPGADGQVQTLLQVLVGVLEDGMPLQAAMDRPRWRLVESQVVVEDGFASGAIEQLRKHGREVSVLAAGGELFGAVSAVVSPFGASGLEAMSDPRREAWASVA